MSTSLSLNPYESPRPPDTGPIGRALVDDSIVIHFHGSLTVDDMFEAERLAQSAWKKHEHWITWTMALLTVLCVLGVGAFDLYSLLYDDEFDAELPSPLGLLVVVIGTGLALYHPRLVRARAMKMWTQSKGPYAWTSGTVTGEAITSASQGAVAVFKWSDFCGYRCSDRVAILYLQYPKQFVIFARTKFQHDDAWTQFLDIVWQKLPPR
jgi:hypothetical protein